MDGRRRWMDRATGLGLAVLAGVLAAACGDRPRSAADEVRQTRFPGQVTAGGGTSGETMSRTQPAPRTPGPAGTPGIPQGAEGNVGGTAMGGTTGGSALGGSGEKTPEQARSGPPESASAPAAASAPPSPASR